MSLVEQNVGLHIVLMFVFFFDRGSTSILYTMFHELSSNLHLSLEDPGQGFSHMIPIQNVHRLFLFWKKSNQPFQEMKIGAWNHQN